MDSELTSTYDQYKRAYATLLNRWKLFVRSNEIRKLISDRSMIDEEDTEKFLYVRKCTFCQSPMNGKPCSNCKTKDHCNICTLSIKGISSFCMVCLHGGHFKCMKEWFKVKYVCSTGCGCFCVSEMSRFNGEYLANGEYC